MFICKYVFHFQLLTEQRYIDLFLRPVLIPFLTAHPDVTTFKNRTTHVHMQRVTRAYLAANNVDAMPWTPYSPDLSPIEHLWDQLKGAVNRRTPGPRT